MGAAWAGVRADGRDAEWIAWCGHRSCAASLLSCLLIPTSSVDSAPAPAPTVLARRRTFEHTLQERGAVLICPGGQAEMCLTNQLHRHKEFSVYSRHKGALLGLGPALGCTCGVCGGRICEFQPRLLEVVSTMHCTLSCLPPPLPTPPSQGLCVWR